MIILLSTEATNTNFIVFGFARIRLEFMINCTRGEHFIHYLTDLVFFLNKGNNKITELRAILQRESQNS